MDKLTKYLTQPFLIEEGINDPGILKAVFLAGGPGSGKGYVGSGLFGLPIGLMLIVICQTQLFTGNTAFFTCSLYEGKIKFPMFLRGLGIVYIGNLIGCLLFAISIYGSDTLKISPWLPAEFTLNFLITSNLECLIHSLEIDFLFFRKKISL